MLNRIAFYFYAGSQGGLKRLPKQMRSCSTGDNSGV